jgi:hypothetical protein
MNRRSRFLFIIVLLSLVAITVQQQVGPNNNGNNGNNKSDKDNDNNNNMNGSFNNMDDGRFNNTQDGRPNFNPNRGRFRNGNDTNTTTAPILLGVGGGLLFLSICLLTARLWSRLRPVMRLQVDDWTVLVATVIPILLTSTEISR